MDNENTIYFIPTISYFWDSNYKAIDIVWLKWTIEFVIKE